MGGKHAPRNGIWLSHIAKELRSELKSTDTLLPCQVRDQHSVAGTFVDGYVTTCKAPGALRAENGHAAPTQPLEAHQILTNARLLMERHITQ